MDDSADYEIKDYFELTNNWHGDPTAYLNRYYSLFYKINNNKEQDSFTSDIYVRQSPNKICVLGIVNPSTDIHSVVMNKKLVGEKVKRDTILCELRDAQDNVIGQVKAQMEGKLLELNSRFEKEGNSLLLNGHHMDTGFIAVIMPKTDETKIQLKGYQTEEEYKISLQNTINNNNNPNLETKPKSMCNIS
jgi:glycine cleavage system H lipoate-binding protein